MADNSKKPSDKDETGHVNEANTTSIEKGDLNEIKTVEGVRDDIGNVEVDNSEMDIKAIEKEFSLLEEKEGQLKENPEQFFKEIESLFSLGKQIRDDLIQKSIALTSTNADLFLKYSGKIKDVEYGGDHIKHAAEKSPRSAIKYMKNYIDGSWNGGSTLGKDIFFNAAIGNIEVSFEFSNLWVDDDFAKELIEKFLEKELLITLKSMSKLSNANLKEILIGKLSNDTEKLSFLLKNTKEIDSEEYLTNLMKRLVTKQSRLFFEHSNYLIKTGLKCPKIILGVAAKHDPLAAFEFFNNYKEVAYSKEIIFIAIENERSLTMEQCNKIISFFDSMFEIPWFGSLIKSMTSEGGRLATAIIKNYNDIFYNKNVLNKKWGCYNETITGINLAEFIIEKNPTNAVKFGNHIAEHASDHIKELIKNTATRIKEKNEADIITLADKFNLVDEKWHKDLIINTLTNNKDLIQKFTERHLKSDNPWAMDILSKLIKDDNEYFVSLINDNPEKESLKKLFRLFINIVPDFDVSDFNQCKWAEKEVVKKKEAEAKRIEEAKRKVEEARIVAEAKEVEIKRRAEEAEAERIEEAKRRVEEARIVTEAEEAEAKRIADEAKKSEKKDSEKEIKTKVDKKPGLEFGDLYELVDREGKIVLRMKKEYPLKSLSLLLPEKNQKKVLRTTGANSIEIYKESLEGLFNNPNAVVILKKLNELNFVKFGSNLTELLLKIEASKIKPPVPPNESLAHPEDKCVTTFELENITSEGINALLTEISKKNKLPDIIDLSKNTPKTIDGNQLRRIENLLKKHSIVAGPRLKAILISKKGNSSETTPSINQDTSKNNKDSLANTIARRAEYANKNSKTSTSASDQTSSKDKSTLIEPNVFDREVNLSGITEFKLKRVDVKSVNSFVETMKKEAKNGTSCIIDVEELIPNQKNEDIVPIAEKMKKLSEKCESIKLGINISFYLQGLKDINKERVPTVGTKDAMPEENKKPKPASVPANKGTTPGKDSVEKFFDDPDVKNFLDDPKKSIFGSEKERKECEALFAKIKEFAWLKLPPDLQEKLIKACEKNSKIILYHLDDIVKIKTPFSFTSKKSYLETLVQDAADKNQELALQKLDEYSNKKWIKRVLKKVHADYWKQFL